MIRFFYIFTAKKLSASGNPRNIVDVWEVVPTEDHPVYVGQEKGVYSNDGHQAAARIVIAKFGFKPGTKWIMGEAVVRKAR